MGCFDTILVPCPECGTLEEFQSKGGDCLLRMFRLDNCPADVMEDANRHAPATCSKCRTKFSVKFEIQTAKVISAKSVVDNSPRNEPISAEQIIEQIQKEKL